MPSKLTYRLYNRNICFKHTYNLQNYIFIRLLAHARILCIAVEVLCRFARGGHVFGVMLMVVMWWRDAVVLCPIAKLKWCIERFDV